MPPSLVDQPFIDIKLWSRFTQRIMAVLLTAGLLVGGLLTAMSIWTQKRQWEDSLALRGQSLVRSLGRAAFVPLVLEDIGALETLADGFKEESDVVYVGLYTAEGKLLSLTPAGMELPSQTWPQSLSLQRIKFAGQGEILDILLPLNYESGTPRTSAKSEVSGFARIGLSEQRVREEIRAATVKNLTLCAGVMFVAFLVGALQIQRMTRQMREFIEQVQMTTELKRTNQELETFSYSVSHDLRAPLRSIDGFSKALLEDYSDRLDQEGKNYLERVRASCQNMAQLIDDLLGLSRVIRREMSVQDVDLTDMARSIADRLKATEPERRIEFVISDNIRVRGDSGLLHIVLENLLGNSWKFTQKKEKAKIEFGMSQKGAETIYSVRDNGAGFDMNYADKLFGAFQRLHDNSQFPGTGIGLATVQRVIQRHGGQIWAEGVVDQGAAFYFTLKIPKERGSL